MEIAKDDRAPMQSLAAAIGADPAFASRLVRIASFIPGVGQKLPTFAAAFNVLGLDHLKSLALGLSAFNLPKNHPIAETDAEPAVITLMDLWEHSLGTAVVAARIAARTESLAPASAFVAGFVHDIGKVLLYRYSKERFTMAASMALEKRMPSTQAETLAFSIDHIEAAEHWCQRVELPDLFRQAVRFHHEQLAALAQIIDEPGVRSLVAVVQAADLICENDGIGKGGDRAELSRELRATLNLQGQDWWQQVQSAKCEIEAARSAFGFLSHAKKLPSLRGQEAKEERATARSTPVNPLGLHAPSTLSREGAAPPGKLSILVVEDHSSLCDLLSLYLMRHGYHVRTASNGAGALEVLAKEEIHLILLDLMLPRLDGFEVLRQIHQTCREHLPYIIVVSAGASERDRNKVLEMGANEYMPKPFHLMRLLERIQVVEKYLR